MLNIFTLIKLQTESLINCSNNKNVGKRTISHTNCNTDCPTGSSMSGYGRTPAALHKTNRLMVCLAVSGSKQADPISWAIKDLLGSSTLVAAGCTDVS